MLSEKSIKNYQERNYPLSIKTTPFDRSFLMMKQQGYRPKARNPKTSLSFPKKRSYPSVVIIY